MDEKHSSWFVYIIQCSDKTLYTGITNNVDERIKTHNTGKGAKYTRGRTPVVLLKSWDFDTKSNASKEEYRIKKLSKAQKIKLLNTV